MLSAVECYKCLKGLPRAPQRDVMSTRATREDHCLPASEFISFLVFVSKSSGFKKKKKKKKNVFFFLTFFDNLAILCQINQIWVISCQKSPAKSYLTLFLVIEMHT